MHQDGPRARKNVGKQIHTMLLVWCDHTEPQWNRNTLMQQKSIPQVLYKALMGFGEKMEIQTPNFCRSQEKTTSSHRVCIKHHEEIVLD